MYTNIHVHRDTTNSDNHNQGNKKQKPKFSGLSRKSSVVLSKAKWRWEIFSGVSQLILADAHLKPSVCRQENIHQDNKHRHTPTHYPLRAGKQIPGNGR